MKIETFTQRQKAQYIYDTYFATDAEHPLNFDLFDTLHSYGAITTEEDCDKMHKKFEQIGYNLWDEMKRFDEKQIKN